MLGPRGAHGVAEGLRRGGGSGDSGDSGDNTASLVLSLDDNAFGDAGALTIAAALLDASEGGSSEGGSLEGGPEGTTPGTASSNAPPPSRVTSFVHTLDLAGNGLSAKGVLAVIMAGGSCGVSELRLFNNDLGTKGCLELAEVLAGAPHAVVPARRAERAAERAAVSRGGGGDDANGAGGEGGEGSAGGAGGAGSAGDVVGVDGVGGVACALRPSPVGATELSLTALDLGGNGMSPDAIAILCVALAGNGSNDSHASAASVESAADSDVIEGVGGALGGGGGDVGGNAAAAAAPKPLPRLRSLGLGGNDMDATAEELVLGLFVSRPDLDIARDKHKVRRGARREAR